jgi:hypothetical protein
MSEALFNIFLKIEKNTTRRIVVVLRFFLSVLVKIKRILFIRIKIFFRLSLRIVDSLFNE